MKRKVMKLGPTTLIVSLPAKWVKKSGIHAGDELDLLEQDHGLVLLGERKKSAPREITVEITAKNKHNLMHILSHIYRRGFEKIILKGNNLGSEVKKITDEVLLGFEVTQRESNYCVLENIAEPSEEKFSTMLRRIFLIIKETHNKITDGFKNGIFAQQDIEDLKKQTDKLVFFCRRIIFREPTHDAILHWELLTYLSKVQHTYYYLYAYVQKKDFVKQDDLLLLLDSLKDYFENYYQAYFNQDAEKVHILHKQKDLLQFGRCEELIASGTNAVIYSYLRELFRTIQVGTSPLLSLFQQY